MSRNKPESGRVSIIQAVQTPLGFFTLTVLVVEVILGLLANRASGFDFTVLVISMIALLFVLVTIVAQAVQRNPDVLLGKATAEPTQPIPKPNPQQEYSLLHGLLARDDLRALVHHAREHTGALIRLACVHTLWSCRPDLAKTLLEAAQDDPNEAVRDHARALLHRFYGPKKDGQRDAEATAFLRTLLPSTAFKELETLARRDENDYVRLACAHTLWSCRPNFAKSVLNDAQDDLAELVRTHARTLLRHFYTPLRVVRTAKDVDFLGELLPESTVKSLAEDARTHNVDHVRLACAHTLWSCRPDLAQAVLEDAQDDLAEPVRDHARALLRRFY
jgi:hypothetical protein